MSVKEQIYKAIEQTKEEAVKFDPFVYKIVDAHLNRETLHNISLNKVILDNLLLMHIFLYTEAEESGNILDYAKALQEYAAMMMILYKAMHEYKDSPIIK